MRFQLEAGDAANTMFDDDGHPKRTGTLFTGTAHIITAVIGSGVLSLAWAVAQLGWIAGPTAIILFSVVSSFQCHLLADCYRSPDPVTGKRNRTYMDAIKVTLGGLRVQICGITQYSLLVGITTGYAIITAISMVSLKRSHCFHNNHIEGDTCHTSNNPYMAIFAIIEIILSQIPNFHKLSFLSIVAAVMSFAYSFIGIGLSIAKIAEGNAHVETRLTGRPIGNGLTKEDKIWNIFSSVGDIAFAYNFLQILIDIQDTLKSSPPENKVMKKATLLAITTCTVFYLLCGLLGYWAFGSNAPGNILTGFGFYEPFWIVDIGNICVIVHLIGAYQVFCQPIFAFVENLCRKKWPANKFINAEYTTELPVYGTFEFSFFRLVWRTLYVILTTVLAMLLPFFNEFVGLLGAFSFFPLTVYFPIEMYMAQKKIRKFSPTWYGLQTLKFFSLMVSLVAGAGSIKGLLKVVKIFKPFHSES